MEKAARNQTFNFLSAIGIILVILGHLNFGVLTVGELFPYYSFQIMIFLFISGYFYNPIDEKKIMVYIKRKALHLLLPYFIWNFIYGIIATLFHTLGFTIGDNISLYNLFIAPILGGHQFMYNATAWFVPALFLVELANIVGRKILSYLKIKNEAIILILYLLIGCLAVYLSQRGSVYDYYRLPARIMFLLPAFQFGRIYKAKLEERDTLRSVIYFPILIIVQLIIVMTHAGLGFSAVWVSSFANTPFTPYLTTITGIAFFLRISKLLSPVIGKSNFVQYLGANTYSVMMNHLFSFMILKSIFSLIHHITPYFHDFDQTAFLSDIYYIYLPGGFDQLKWVYLIIGIFIPLAIAYVIQKVAEIDKIPHLRTLSHNS